MASRLDAIPRKKGSTCNQTRSCLKKNRPPDAKLPHMSRTRVQHGRESANLIEQIYAEEQQTIKSNSSTLEDELEALNEEVRKEKKENLEWKKLQRVMELAKKKKQKDMDQENRKKEKEMEVANKRKLKELQLAEKKRQKEIEQVEKKRFKEESQNEKRAKSKAIKQQLELSLTVSISPPLQVKQTQNVDNDSASVGTLMSLPEAMTESKGVNKPSAVPLAVEAAAQSDPISTGENGCGMGNAKRHKSKEKKIFEKYKKNDDNRENKKDINKWSSFFKQFKSYNHIDSINGSLRRVESKHNYTKKEKQQISKSKGGYVESSNISQTFSTNNSTRGRRDLKINNKELKKKKKGNNDENVSNCAFTTVNSVSSIHQTTPTNNNEDDNVINNTNIITSTTKAGEDPIVKIASSKSKPAIVNSCHQMKRHTSNSSNTNKISKNKNQEIVGDNNKEDHSIINNTINKQSTSKASENAVVKTASITVNSSHQIKQRASNCSTASKISKSKKRKIVGDNKEDHSIIDNNIIKRSTNVRASEIPVVKTASFKSASITVNSSYQMKQRASNVSTASKISKSKKWKTVGDNNKEDHSIIDNNIIKRNTKVRASASPVVKTASFKSASVTVNSSHQTKQRTSFISLTSKISKNKIEETVGDYNKEDGSIIENTSIRCITKAFEDPVAKTVSFKSASVMVNSSLQMNRRTSNNRSLTSKISKNKIGEVVGDTNKEATEDSVAKTVSFKSKSVMAKPILQMDQRTSTTSVDSKISKSNKVERVCECIKKDVSIINNTEIRSTTKANEGPIVKRESSNSAPVIVKSSHVVKRRISKNSIASKISKSKKGDKVVDNNKKDINIINQSIINASETPVVKTGSSKSTPVLVDPSLLKKQRNSNNSNTSKLSKSKNRERVGDDGDNSVKNNGSQSSKGSKSKKENKDYRKRNESESSSRNSKTKDTTSIIGSKRSTPSIVNVCSNNQCLSKKVSVIEDDIVVKELEKIEKGRLDRASGVEQSDAGDGPVAKHSLVFMARRNWRQRRSSVEEQPVVQPDDEKPENEHERGRIPCKKFLEELTSNSEQGVDVTLSHNLLVLVKLCMFYLKQSMKVMKNFCFIITRDERDPEVTCLTETVGQAMKVFWVMGKTTCKCLQCQKIQSQNINEQCT